MDKNIEFNFNLNWYGISLVASVLLILMKAFGIIECSIWIALAPILIFAGLTVLIIFIVGVITCYLILFGKVSDDDELDIN